jgi:hypothetical protein
MEDLWKVANLDYRIDDVADRAQYERLVRRFHDEEERYNRDHLLYGDDHLSRTGATAAPQQTFPSRHSR